MRKWSVHLFFACQLVWLYACDEAFMRAMQASLEAEMQQQSNYQWHQRQQQAISPNNQGCYSAAAAAGMQHSGN